MMNNYIYKRKLTGAEVKIDKVSLGSDGASFGIQAQNGATYNGLSEFTLKEKEFHNEFELSGFDFNI